MSLVKQVVAWEAADGTRFNTKLEAERHNDVIDLCRFLDRLPPTLCGEDTFRLAQAIVAAFEVSKRPTKEPTSEDHES